MKTGIDSLIELVNRGCSQKQMGLILGVSERHISRRLLVLRKQGHLTSQQTNKLQKKLPSDVQLIGLYRTNGLIALSKKFDCSISTVSRKLLRLGVLDSSRQFQKIHTSQASRTFDRSIFEFKSSTKKFCFKREHHFCQECHKPIEGNWRNATFHHTKPIAIWHIKLTPEELRHPDNCMVLHHDCHYDPTIFKKLHGFDIQHITTKLPHRDSHKIPTCISCKSVPAKTKSGHCYRCAYNLIAGGFALELNLKPTGLIDLRKRLIKLGFLRSGIEKCPGCGRDSPNLLGHEHLCHRCLLPKAKALMNQGYTQKAAAANLGIKYNTLFQWLYPDRNNYWRNKKKQLSM